MWQLKILLRLEQLETQITVLTFACFYPASTLPVLLTDSGKTLTFFNHNFRGEFQTVTFEGNEIRKLFHGSFHKVSMCLRKMAC